MKRLILAATLSAVVATQSAQAQTCVAPKEAEALMLTMAPSAITSVAQTCSANLGANAYLIRSAPRLSAKFAAEADAPAVWPQAREALRKIAGDDNAALLDSELAKPMMTAMIGPMLTKEIKPADCPKIDRVLSLIDPLPARNAIGLIVAIMEMADGGRKKSKLPICPSVQR